MILWRLNHVELVPHVRIMEYIYMMRSVCKPCSCVQFIKAVIFTASHARTHTILQVTQKSVSGTASHVRSAWLCNEIKGSYDNIIITIVQSYTGKNITRLLPLALLLVLRIRNNTDGYKLVIFSSIAFYYGDTYIIAQYMQTLSHDSSSIYQGLHPGPLREQRGPLREQRGPREKLSRAQSVQKFSTN